VTRHCRRRGPPAQLAWQISSPPAGRKDGMDPSNAHPPYWTFDYEVTASAGLKLKNICVVDAHHVGGSELIMEEIVFADLLIEHDGGTAPLPFAFARAFSNPDSFLVISEEGTDYSGTDDLYQRGLLLVLVDTIPNVAQVTLELSIVFRGSKNDFDPAGVPVAVIAWPQIAWSWKPLDGRAGKRVNRFHGTVKITVCNYMSHSHGSGPAAPQANVPNFFADSNYTYNQTNRPGANWFMNVASNITFLPYGWGKLFDYAKLNVQKEFEFVAAAGPGHPNATAARWKYLKWPATASSRIGVLKFPGQGDYDNMHLHAKMEAKTATVVDVHAPFCGHSCLHTHWRWGVAVPFGSFPNFEFKAKYMGWSRGTVPKAHALAGGTLTPPNQHVKFALRKAPPGTSQPDLVNSNDSTSLDWLRKQICYQAEIIAPDAGCRQVIWPHGIGWAFRYALPSESDAVGAILDHYRGANAPDEDTATQDQISDFFVNDVYPQYRYMGGTAAGGDQVPDGSYFGTAPPTPSPPPGGIAGL
jgi:hypothetical protein